MSYTTFISNLSGINKTATSTMTKINLSKYDQLSGLGHFTKTDFVTKQLDIKDKKRLKQHNNNRQYKDKKQDDK